MTDNVDIIFDHTNHQVSGDYSDAIDFGGMGAKVNLSVLSEDGLDLAIDAIPYSSGLKIDVDASASGPYFFGITDMGGIPQGLRIWVKDTFSKDSLDLRTGNYHFNIDNTNPDTYGKNRFTVVLRQE